MSENRRSIRIRTEALVDVTADAEVLLFHRIRDLGEGGLSIDFPTLEPLGTELDLSLSLPGTDETLELVGVVVRASETPVRHLGIRFQGVTPLQQEALRRYLAGAGARGGEG